MIKKVVLLTLIFFLCSCASREKENYPELSADIFTEMVNCYNATGYFFSTWLKNGGKVESSILKIREHIKNDDISDFSILIKDAWETQEKMGFYEKIQDIGKWRPIQGKRFETVTDSYFFSKKNNVEGCEDLGAWNETMSEQFLRVDGNLQPRIVEFPEDKPWEYPENMLWLKYWLFVNIKE